MSNVRPPTSSTASYTLPATKSAARPEAAAASLAAATAGAEKSRPVTVAPPARPRQGVHPEVALRVDERAPGHVADLGHLERPQGVGLRVGEEALQVVELAGDVDGRPLVPPRPVQVRPVVTHRPRLARRRPDPAAFPPLGSRRCGSGGSAPPWQLVGVDAERRLAHDLVDPEPVGGVDAAEAHVAEQLLDAAALEQRPSRRSGRARCRRPRTPGSRRSAWPTTILSGQSAPWSTPVRPVVAHPPEVAVDGLERHAHLGHAALHLGVVRRRCG